MKRWGWIVLGVMISFSCVLLHADQNSGDALIDKLTEPVVRPNKDTLKSWLKGKTIVLEKKPWWFDAKEKLDASKIQNLRHEGGTVFLNAGTNLADSNYSFEYPYRGHSQTYRVSFTYSYKIKFGSIERQLEKTVLMGP